MISLREIIIGSQRELIIDEKFSNEKGFQTRQYFFSHSEKGDPKLIPANSLVGGYLCNNPEFRGIFAQNENSTYSGLTSGQACLIPRKGFQNEIFSTNNFKKDNFKLVEKSVVQDLIEPLSHLQCQINVFFLNYILENLHCIIETGCMPPLKNIGPDNFQKWVTFQRSVLVSGQSQKIFTGKKILITKKSYPQGLTKKLKENVFKNKKYRFNSIQSASKRTTRILKTAIGFINLPIYFMLELDKRGRVYYRNEFSPVQDSFVRSLLIFSKPSLIKTGGEAEFFFFVALGKAVQGHKTMQDAFTFVCKNEENLLNSLENLNWVTFKEPFIALNLILQFQKYKKSSCEKKKGVNLYINIEFDATSSVFQINSALIKNKYAAKATNLIPYEKSLENFKLTPSQDIYTDLLHNFNEKVNEKKSEIFSLICNPDNNESMDQEIKNFLRYSDLFQDFVLKLGRFVIKNIVMTRSYGKGKSGLIVFLMKQINQLQKEKTLELKKKKMKV